LSALTTSSASVVTFGDGVSAFADGYTEAGLTISVTGNDAPFIRDWPLSPPGGLPPSGEREYLFNDDQALIRFSLTGGGTFDLTSFDIENPAGLRPVSAFGVLRLVASTGSVLTFDASTFGTKAVGSGFAGISYFDMQIDGEGQVTVDNIVFTSPAAAVPEPESLVLTAVGLLGIAASRRRSRADRTNDRAGDA
jgi:hypothetical protein